MRMSAIHAATATAACSMNFHTAAKRPEIVDQAHQHHQHAERAHGEDVHRVAAQLRRGPRRDERGERKRGDGGRGQRHASDGRNRTGVKFPGAVRQVDPRGAQRKVAAQTGEQHRQDGGGREGHDVGVHAILARPEAAGSCTEGPVMAIACEPEPGKLNLRPAGLTLRGRPRRERGARRRSADSSDAAPVHIDSAADVSHALDHSSRHPRSPDPKSSVG